MHMGMQNSQSDWCGIIRGEAEEKVAAAWRDVLHLERVGIHANFFSVGGTSLLAGMIAFRVGATFGIDASVALLLRHPTIAELAAKVSSQAAEGQERQGIPGASFSPEQKARGVPLSFYQEQMVSLGMQGFQAYDQLFAYEVRMAFLLVRSHSCKCEHTSCILIIRLKKFVSGKDMPYRHLTHLSHGKPS